MSSFIKYSGLLFLSASLLFACGEQPENDQDASIPQHVLNEREFAKVLADFALAEGAVNLNVKSVPLPRFDTVYAFDPLKDNQVSKGRYDSTIQFYAQHPALYKKVYETALALLSEMQARRDSVRTDSVAK